jgi:tetratricopeptide (TPR) repeat protein
VILALLLLAGDPTLHLERALELAQQQRYEEAYAELLAGRLLAPRDKRFPLELAGLAWRRRDRSTAKSYLKEALRIDPADTYANDFLATVYLLEGNTEAALKHWNRTGQPRLSGVTLPASVDPVLMDRLLGVPLGEALDVERYRAACQRLKAARLFVASRLELSAEPDTGNFRLSLSAIERQPWMGMMTALSGLPFQTLFPEFHNLGRKGVYSGSLLRWDAQKRRALTEMRFPLRRDPRWFWNFRAGYWRETWYRSDAGDFRLNAGEALAELHFLPNSRSVWWAGVAATHRGYRNLDGYPDGFGLKTHAGGDLTLLRLPEQSAALNFSAQVELGRVFRQERALYARTRGGLHFNWQPHRWEVSSRLRAGRVFGAAPFDELFQLGNDRDHDLRLRAHPAFRDGKKGRGLVSGSYVLLNQDALTRLWNWGFVKIHGGPFLDAARAPGWHWDAGMQCRIEALPGVSVVLSYGWDLGTGRGAFFGDVPR